MTLRCRQFSDWLTKMSITHEWVTCFQVWCLYESGMTIPFSKQYRNVTNHLHLYATNFYIFVFTFTLLLLTMWLSLINANTSSNTTFTTIFICHQIITGPLYLFFLFFMWKFSIKYRHVTHQIKVPGREESNAVAKTMKFYICFPILTYNVIFKYYSSQKGESLSVNWNLQ